MFGRTSFSTLRLALCVLALLSASLAPALAGSYLTDGGAGTIDVPSTWYDVGTGKGNFSYTTLLVFPDGYPGPNYNYPTFYNTPILVVDSISGSYPVDSSTNLVSVALPLNTNNYITFGPAVLAFHSRYSGYSENQGVDEGTSNTIKATKTQGTSVCQVVTPDPKKPGSFLPLSGAKIEFYQSTSPSEYVDGSKFAVGGTVTPRGTKGLTYAVFGVDPSSSVKTDYPYPSGRALAAFSFRASCDGYKTASGDNGSTMVGNLWPGHGCTIILVPNSSSDASSTSNAPGDPTGQNQAVDGTGKVVAPTSGDTGTGTGTGTGTDDSSGFFAGFWDKLKAFFSDMFTLQQADVDDLTAVKDKFAGYGPFGLVTSFKREWDGAFPLATGPDGSDPHYWDFPTSLTLGAAGKFGSAYPAGYDPDKAYQPPPSPVSSVGSLFPDHFDMAPYKDYILRGRFLALWGLWIFVAVSMIRRFAPAINI